MLNLNRVDPNDHAVDQQLFAIAFMGDTSAPSGVLVQHGDWEGRTSHPAAAFGKQLRPAV
jgi:hypothetical protein